MVQGAPGSRGEIIAPPPAVLGPACKPPARPVAACIRPLQSARLRRGPAAREPRAQPAPWSRFYPPTRPDPTPPPQLCRLNGDGSRRLAIGPERPARSTIGGREPQRPPPGMYCGSSGTSPGRQRPTEQLPLPGTVWAPSAGSGRTISTPLSESEPSGPGRTRRALEESGPGARVSRDAAGPRPPRVLFFFQ